ncbi:MAG: hypothetical protein Q8L23_01145 [Caulobacter sp.]|nr:hypothetical protein [Caulobacter sp.]
MRAGLGLAVFVAMAPLAVAAQPAAEPDTNFPSLDKVGLDWDAAPRGDRMARFFPMRARAQKITRGMAMLDCTTLADGHVSCVIPFEAPADMMFGEAALHVMKTSTVTATDGAALEGRRFSVTLRFGYWPPSALPKLNRKGLEGTSLVWRTFPALGDHWPGALPKRGEWFIVDLACTPGADGHLQCEPTGDNGTPKGYSKAVAEAMADARVRTTDGGSPEGQAFKFQYSITGMTP